MIEVVFNFWVLHAAQQTHKQVPTLTGIHVYSPAFNTFSSKRLISQSWLGAEFISKLAPRSHLWLPCANLYMDNWNVKERRCLTTEISTLHASACEGAAFLAYMHQTPVSYWHANQQIWTATTFLAYKIHEFLCGSLKMEMRQCLHESLIGRCSAEESVSQEWLLSGQESLLAWLDDDRWCQWDKRYLMDQT